MRSKVWQYFDKIHESGVAKAQCQECGKILCTPNGSTSALKTHLKKCRNIETGKENLRRKIGLCLEKEFHCNFLT